MSDNLNQNTTRPSSRRLQTHDSHAAADLLAVRCRNVVKQFGKGDTALLALRGVNFDVWLGELTLLVGPSGCGKTTLLSVIAGILDPTSGDVRVLGTDVAVLSNNQKVGFRRKNIGFVFQQYNLLPALTAAENVAVPLLIGGIRRKQAVEIAADRLDQLGLADRIYALPDELSGGQQQRVAIARALVHEPRLLVCDEPTAALDSENGQRILELLRKVAVQPDRSVIIVTHDNRIFHFGDRIAHMDDGHIVGVEANLFQETSQAGHYPLGGAT